VSPLVHTALASGNAGTTQGAQLPRSTKMEAHQPAIPTVLARLLGPRLIPSSLGMTPDLSASLAWFQSLALETVSKAKPWSLRLSHHAVTTIGTPLIWKLCCQEPAGTLQLAALGPTHLQRGHCATMEFFSPLGQPPWATIKSTVPILVCSCLWVGPTPQPVTPKG
jgi:hypothetical protein